MYVYLQLISNKRKEEKRGKLPIDIVVDTGDTILHHGLVGEETDDKFLQVLGKKAHVAQG